MVGVYECAVFSADVYQDDPRDIDLPAGWRAFADTTGKDPSVPRIYANPATQGFDARAYENTSDGEIVVAFRGTDESIDMPSNILQFIGQISPQLYDGVRFFMAVLEEVTGQVVLPRNRTITLTGHSLGGGLASQVAVLTGRNAIAFTPAPHRGSISVYIEQLRRPWPESTYRSLVQDPHGGGFHPFVPQSIRRFVKFAPNAPTTDRIVRTADRRIRRLLYDGELAQALGGNDVTGQATLYNQGMLQNDRYVIRNTFSPWIAGLETNHFGAQEKGMRYALHSYGLYVLQAYLEREHPTAASWLESMPALVPQLCNKHVTWMPLTDQDPLASLSDFLLRLVTAADAAGNGNPSTLDALLGDLARIANLPSNHIGLSDPEINTGLLQLALQHAANQVRAPQGNQPAGIFDGSGTSIQVDLSRYSQSGRAVGLAQLAGYLEAGGQSIPVHPSTIRIDAQTASIS